MKIQCEKCQAVYNVPDEKIQGRPIRFTCKRCGNIVRYKPEQTSKMTMEMSAAEVGPRMTGEMAAISQEDENAKTVFDEAKVAKAREEIAQAKEKKQAESTAQTKQEPQPRMTIEGKPLEQQPVASGPSIWYVAYSKNKRGPMSLEQIQQHLFEIEIKGEIYVWKSGFDSWKRIQEVGEFAGVWAALEAKKNGQPVQISTQTATPAAAKPVRPSFSDLLKSELGDVEEKKAQVTSQKIDISELMTKETVKETAPVKEKEPVKTSAAPVVMEEYRPPEKKKFPLKSVLTLLALLIIVIATPLTLAYKEIIEIPGLDKVPLIGVYFKKVEVDRYAKMRAQWEMLVKIDETKIAMQATKEEEEKARIEAEKKKALEEKQARIARAAKRQRAGGGNSNSPNVTSFDFGEDQDDMDTIGELNTTNIKREAVLEQSQVNEVINKNMGKIASCVRGQKEYGENVMGTMNVRFTISRRGSVVRANILTDKFKGTYVADCVAATIERLRFPRSGASMTVNYPFNIK